MPLICSSCEREFDSKTDCYDHSCDELEGEEHDIPRPIWVVYRDKSDQFFEIFGGFSDSRVRSYWASEDQDFTPWLAENPEPLEIALDTHLHDIETEVPTNQFRADIVAENTDSECVVIENQLGTSDHAHLGKLLTYGSYFDADNLVWVAESFTMGHIRTVIELTEQLIDARITPVTFAVHFVGEGHPVITFEPIW